MESATQSIPNLLQNITENPMSITFHWFDYTLFSIMLLLSVLIGLYFGCFGTKQSTVNEYLMGGKKMSVLPIAISQIASHTSGLSLLSLPADVYLYGASYWLGSISLLITGLVTNYVFLPVFYNLEITSTYEYLERRFNNKIRTCASLLFALSLFLYLPIVIYVPALAFSAATGINVHFITPVVCGVCIFYTTIGGLKTVVWTDTLQFTVTFGALIAVFVLGINSSGGIVEIWNKAVENQRLDLFNFTINPTKRDTFWAVMIGLTVHWIAQTSINQSCTQKFLSVSSLNKSKRSVIYYCIGMAIVKSFCVLIGLIIFKRYSDCDPLKTKQINKNDQLMPYYVMDIAGNIPGLPGLFIAGVFCASLSTLSAYLNCLAGTIYEDFVRKWLQSRKRSARASDILKLIVITTGVVSTLIVFIVEKLGGLLELAIRIGSVAHGPLLGLFVLGVLFPKANSKGALVGALTALSCVGFIVTGANYYRSQGFHEPRLPLSTNGCQFITANFTFNNINMTNTFNDQSPPIFLFRLSFYYMTLLGTIITLTVGFIVSFFTSKDERPVDKTLLSPIIHFMLKPEQQIEYYDVNKAMNVMLVNSANENIMKIS